MFFKKIIKILSSGIAIISASFMLSVYAFAADLPENLSPMGQIVGISLNAGGAVISELSEIETESGIVSPAKDAGLLPGDVITSINNICITDSSSLISALECSSGNEISVEFIRNGETLSSNITPYFIDSRPYIGVWIRDSLAGIGTVTFYDPETGIFGALGHSISESEDGGAIPYADGNIYSADIAGIIPGESGNPGQITGTFNKEDVIGTLVSNQEVGIFGYIGDCEAVLTDETVPVAEKCDIKTGSATILSAVSGEVKEYSIEITRVYSDYNCGRSMMIKVTDDDLIALTGGIVQGMSGSPIIQDGNLIGAVTHVLINDPTKGYAVSIEDMINAAYQMDSSSENAA